MATDDEGFDMRHAKYLDEQRDKYARAFQKNTPSDC